MTRLKDLAENESYIEATLFRPGFNSKIDERRFRIVKTGLGKIPMSYNSFAHCLYGTVSPNGNGARMETQFRLPIFSTIFVAIWLSGAFIIAWGGGIAGIVQCLRTSNASSIGAIFSMLLFPFLGVAFLHFCRWLSNSNDREVLDLLVGAFGQPEESTQKS